MNAAARVVAVVVACAAEHDELLRILYGETAKEHLVDQREDGGIRADAERNREHRHRGEEGGPRQPPPCIAEIPSEMHMGVREESAAPRLTCPKRCGKVGAMRAFRRTAVAAVVGVAVVGAGPRGALQQWHRQAPCDRSAKRSCFRLCAGSHRLNGARLTGSASMTARFNGPFGSSQTRALPPLFEPFSIPHSWERQRPARARIIAPIQQPVTVASLGWTPSLPEGGAEADVVIASVRSFSADEVRGRIVMADGDAGADFDRRLAAAGACSPCCFRMRTLTTRSPRGSVGSAVKSPRCHPPHSRATTRPS